MPVFFARRLQNVLVPDGDESHAEFERVPRGRILRVDVTQPRNLQHHKLFWSMCARIGQGVGQEAEWVERAFKVETGHFDLYEYGGRESLVLRSIAFSAMDQIAFRTFFERCVEIAYAKWRIPPESLADLLAPQEVQKRR